MIGIMGTFYTPYVKQILIKLIINKNNKLKIIKKSGRTTGNGFNVSAILSFGELFS